MKSKYIYLFVRKDLSLPQQIIQTSHAVDEMNKRLWLNKLTKKSNYMVLFEVESETKLIAVSELLEGRKIKHNMFFEPYIRSYTAIATAPISEASRHIFSIFKLKT